MERQKVKTHFLRGKAAPGFARPAFGLVSAQSAKKDKQNSSFSGVKATQPQNRAGFTLDLLASPSNPNLPGKKQGFAFCRTLDARRDGGAAKWRSRQNGLGAACRRMTIK
ncbi:MAG: hypothetical protein LBU11_02915 [Zoogloeaceae bacterium]|nr:hypothetical protein [Zoogloeaceae bacterium]